MGFFPAPLTPTPNPILYTGKGITVEETGTSTETQAVHCRLSASVFLAEIILAI
jgi:hypothetical protein